MQVKVEHPTKTEAVVTVIANEDELRAIKEHVLGHFQGRVKVPGFREGKIPANILEKHVDSGALQNDFLEEGIEQLYMRAIQAQKLRPVDKPQISIQKFVPFTTLEFEAKLPVVGELKLTDYKAIRKTKPVVKLEAKDIQEVLKSLQARLAEKKDVDRPAKNGDQVYIDFQGVDAKGKAVNGADGKDYPLLLGSNAFIPGFEENLVGLKANDDKTFTLTFPKDYGIKALANKKVTFTVQVTKVQEVIEPKLDDAFAAKVGPFKTVAELKADIKKQVTIERQNEADRAFENELIQAISNKSTVTVPDVLVNDQIERMEQEERQNLTYRGQTWQEHLEQEGVTEEQHREQKRPQAEERIKASLVMAEIAENEGLEVTPEELEIRMQLLKGQYQDPQMQAELEKPEARRDVAGRILTEKTLEKVVGYATK
ncbi:MAG TPA: trigger factor [Candidatus Saccharimonadales bacterium]|nr:trigger factor [Candidatus Saccharimonadales bacterium]